LLIAAFHIVILIGFVKGIQENSKELANICLYFITAAWAMNMISSMIDTVTTVYKKIRNFIRKRRAAKVEGNYRVKTVPEIEPKEDKTVDLSY
jgi:ABC-type polysaccharide/polyol phosphate export permease